MVVFEGENKKIIIEGNCIDYYSEDVLFSKIYLDEPLKYSFYLVATVLGVLNNAKKILILGTGLGTAIQQFKKLLPDAKITAVDIDEEVFLLGEKYLGLAKYDDIDYVVEDAVEYVKRDKDYYDYIMVDLYDGKKLLKDFVEVDFLHNIHSRLSEEGVLAFNSSMREFSYLDNICNVNNPLYYIYQNMFLAGFVEITKLDFFYCGWIHCFKANRPIESFENTHNNSEYINTALGVQRIFSHKIEKNTLSNTTLKSNDLMMVYRDYLLNLIMKIRRGSTSVLCTEEGKNEIIKLFLDYTRKKVAISGAGSVIKNMYVCDDVNYFKELDILLKRYNYSLEDVADIIMLPEKNILGFLDDMTIDSKFKIYGNYQYDIVSVNDNGNAE